MAIYAKINGIKEFNNVYDQLHIDVYYRKDATFNMPRGIYLHLKPVKVTKIGDVDIVSCTLYSSDPKTNGLLFLLEEVNRKNTKKEIAFSKAYELHKDEIAEAYNRFNRNEIQSLVYSLI